MHESDKRGSDSLCHYSDNMYETSLKARTSGVKANKSYVGIQIILMCHGPAISFDCSSLSGC